MALTSRLELEVDSGGAEQKVIDMRKALDALDQAGLRVFNTFNKSSSEFTNLALSLSKVQAANDKASQASDKAAKSADDQAKAAANQRKELDSLLGKIDPLTKKLNELAAQETALAKARDSGQINASAYDAYNKKIQESLNVLAGATKAQQQLGETAEEAKARIMAVAVAAVESAKAQQQLSGATDEAAESAAAAMRAQLDQSAAQRRAAKLAEESSVAQQQVASSTQKAAVATAEDANALAKLIAQLDPTVAALKRLDAQQDLLSKSHELGLLPKADFEKYSASLDHTRDRLTNFDEGLTKTGNTAKQTSAAMRTLPAQFSDIFVSLQAGQSPVTVFLQQGAQIKDSFGGIGAAAKAVGGYLLDLVNPFTVAAAAAAALGLAYYQGSEETVAFKNALALTGNTAGTSAGQLASFAEHVSASTGTVGKASEVLAQLASSTRIPAASFELLATSAIKFEEATGQAASETVANFEKIAKDPVKASLALNESLNYLTASTYSQIKALQDQGDVQAAAKIADEEYSKALSTRADSVKKNLGSIETGWNAVKNAAKRAWDAALDIGREKTFEEKMADLQEQLANAQRLGSGSRGTGNRGTVQIQADIDDLSFEEADKTRRAKAKSAAQQAQQQSVEDAIYLDKLHDEFDTNATKRAQKLAEYKAVVARKQLEADKAGDQSLAISQEQQAKDIADINEKWADKKTRAAKAYVEDAGSKELDQAKQQYAVLVQQSQQLDVQTGKLKALGPAQQELIKWEQELAEIKEKKTLTAAQKSLLADADAITNQKKLNAELEKGTEARKIAAEQAKQLAEFTQAQADALSRFQQSLDNQVAGIGLGAEGRKRLQDDLALQNDYAHQLEQLRRDKIGGKITQDTYDKQTAILRGTLDKELQAYKDNYAKIDAARANWQNGMTSALQDYLYETTDIAGQTYSLITDGLHEFEDALVTAVDTGKLSFKRLADSVIADLERMAAKAYVVLPLLGALGLTGSVAGGGLGVAGGGAGGGGAGGVSAGSLLNGASSLYSAATGWGKAIYTGFQSGGLSGAWTGLSDYTSGVLASWDQAAGQLFGTVTNGAGMTYAPLSAQPGALGQVGNAVPWAAGIGGALYGYSQSGLKGAATGAAGGIGGAMLGQALIPIPILGAAIGGALGSYIGGSLFGGSWQTKDQGISLGVTDGDLSAQMFEYQKKKGGLFGSNKKRTRYSALDADTQSALDDTYEATTGAVFDLFDKLNVKINDGVLDGLSVAATQISTKGKTAEQIQAEITKWFGTVADSVTSAINTATGTGLDGYSFQGLTDFVNNLYTVNDIFTTLKFTLYDTSVAGGKLAESLSASAGGLANLQTITSAYYDNFYTDTEKADNTLAAVRKQFADIDIAFPNSREGFRAMIEGIDRTTVAGQQLFITLTALAGNAASAYTILEQRASAATQALINGASSSFSAVQRSIDAQKASINESLTTASQSVTDLKSVASSLDNALKSLRGTSEGAVTTLRAQALATLQSALATARAGKSLAGFEGLDDALSVVTSNNTDLYSSLTDFNRDQGHAAALIDELNTLNGKQLTNAEKSVKALQDQLDRLDDQLKYAQAQLDILNGVDNSVLSVKDAIDKMNTDLLAALNALGGKNLTPAQSGTAVDAAYKSVYGADFTADAAGKAYWQNQLATGALTVAQLVEAIRNAAKANGTLPAFADGGSFGGGIRLVGERGPEIELTGPSRIISNRDAAKALSSVGSGSGDTATAERLAWTNRLLNQVLNAINRQTTQGVPALQVNG
ncbi:phage tail tape measure protein [Pseudomonas sp. NPDC090202]|uniref:phage tail tape measure protein n=1 Tax=Pseudomonas sp. NPDC090202 TaxID=3364476 RepID=UPI003803E1BF